MHILDSGHPAIRPEHFAGFFATGLVVLMLAGWSFPVKSGPEEALTRREVGLYLSRAVMMATGVVDLPPDLDRSRDADLSPMIASGYMGLFPDGTFRPNIPMRVGEVLSIWARLWRNTAGKTGNTGKSSSPVSDWRWDAGDLSLLAAVNADAAAGVASFSPDAPATHGFWRYLPLPTSDQSHCSPAPCETAGKADPQTTGRVVDAVTGKPIPGAVGTIDGKAFATDADGGFVIPDAESDSIRDVFVAVDGYRSLSLRWNRKLRPELKLSLKQFRAPLDIRVLTADGAPATGIRIALEESQAGLTDEDGMTRLRSVRPGYHHLCVDSPEREPASMLISVAENGGIQTVRLPASSSR